MERVLAYAYAYACSTVLGILYYIGLVQAQFYVGAGEQGAIASALKPRFWLQQQIHTVKPTMPISIWTLVTNVESNQYYTKGRSVTSFKIRQNQGCPQDVKSQDRDETETLNP